MSIQRLILLVLAVVTAPALAEINEAELRPGIVTLFAYEGPVRIRAGTGFVVQVTGQRAHIVTSASLLGGDVSLTGLAPDTGLETAATVLRVDAPIDFALLSIASSNTSTNLMPLVFSRSLPEVGEPVWSVSWVGNSPMLVRGTLVNAYTMPGQSVGILSHSASAAEGAGTTLLLNECGQVIGINLGFRSADGNTRALDGNAIRTLLAREQVQVQEAVSPCASAMRQAEQQAEVATEAAQRASQEAAQAQQVARNLEQRLQASTQANVALENRAREARERADAALAAAAKAQREAEDTRLEMERQTAAIKAETEAVMRYLERDREAAEERFRQTLAAQGRAADATRNQLWLALVVIVLLVGLFAVLVIRRPAGAQQAVVPKVARRTPVPGDPAGSTVLHNEQLSEYVLDGRDEDGIRYLLRISGDQLVTPDGIVIGRNPQDSPYTINHADVSRKHARIKVMKNRVFIEDLGSTNGTSVNGQSIDEKGPVAVNSGDQIIIGSVVMKLRVLGA